ncbi:alpha-2-HS-glycoprotein [Sorex araneus]|uniref:alpha-2-HS-glycoprotein n=1 Tax=Sorex araneus TaxID=42254 RepID=UPI002433D0F0|nr:alpha-2-HS-glycoprotein [Sorex araneus]
MKSLSLLLFLSLLTDCRSLPASTGNPAGFRELDCDDPESEQAAQAAVDYINSNRQLGYKHTLNQIDKVKVWPRRPTGEIYELELDTLETTCHALDPTPLANCSVRQLAQHAVEGDCDIRLLKQDGQFSVVFAKCDSTPDSAEDVRKVCANCPLLAPLNHTKVVHAVDAALAAFNAQSNGSYFQLVEASRAQLVNVPPSTYVEFAVAATDCVAKDVTNPATCNMLAERQYGFCKATLTEKVNGEDVAVTCTVFQAQPQVDAGASNPVVDAAPPAPSPADPAPAAMVVGPVVMSVPPGPPLHRAHYDLRHSFSGFTSVESASGETFTRMKKPKPAVAGPMARPCPGKIRYFNV